MSQTARMYAQSAVSKAGKCAKKSIFNFLLGVSLGLGCGACRLPNSSKVKAIPDQGSNSNSDAKSQLKSQLIVEMSAIVENFNACPKIYYGKKINLRQENVLTKFVSPGAQMLGLGPDGQKFIRFQNTQGFEINSKKPFSVVAMNTIAPEQGNKSEVVSSYARFDSGTFNFCQMGSSYQPPYIEIFDCKANPEELASAQVTNQQPALVMRVNTINGVKWVQKRIRLRSLGAALANHCSKSQSLKTKYGPNCDELPFAQVLHVPDPKVLKIGGLFVKQSTYALLIGSEKKPQIVFQIEDGGLSSTVTNLDEDTEPSSPVELWIPYFLSFEDMKKSNEQGIRDSTNLAAEILGNFVPGGGFAVKTFELAVEAVVDKVLTAESED
jgi:hypothetical protein